ncbi:MAG TPA: hypothetical protein VKW70_04210 [Terriglobia bacterium]|nr:hypothetical protein [Terriglobia bacterium]
MAVDYHENGQDIQQHTGAAAHDRLNDSSFKLMLSLVAGNLIVANGEKGLLK